MKLTTIPMELLTELFSKEIMNCCYAANLTGTNFWCQEDSTRLPCLQWSWSDMPVCWQGKANPLVALTRYSVKVVSVFTAMGTSDELTSWQLTQKVPLLQETTGSSEAATDGVGWVYEAIARVHFQATALHQDHLPDHQQKPHIRVLVEGRGRSRYSNRYTGDQIWPQEDQL